MEREAESKKTEKEQKRIEEISERKPVDLSDNCSHYMIRHKPLVLHTHTHTLSALVFLNRPAAALSEKSAALILFNTD